MVSMTLRCRASDRPKVLEIADYCGNDLVADGQSGDFLTFDAELTAGFLQELTENGIPFVGIHGQDDDNEPTRFAGDGRTWTGWTVDRHCGVYQVACFPDGTVCTESHKALLDFIEFRNQVISDNGLFVD